MKLRSKKLNKEYQYFKTYIWDGKNPFNDPELEIDRFNHWKVVINKFGYDTVLNKYYLLVPLKEVEFFSNLEDDAKKEFFDIKNDLKRYFLEDLDFFKVNERKNMSVKSIFHAHIGKRKWWFKYPITLLFN